MPVNSQRLKTAGPIDPSTGFPMWFEDGNGVRLELVLNQDELAPVIGERPQPDQPLLLPKPGDPREQNFPDEAFYFAAEAQMSVAGNGVVGRARLIIGLEAAFGGAGTPKWGMNVVFARIRVRMDDLIPGAKYTVTHPYGRFDDLEADDRGRVFHTEDLGIVEGDPTAVLGSGQVAPFLVYAGAPAAPNGYIGDGVTPRQVTGSPFNTNLFKVDGPAVNPDSTSSVQTDLFSIQGRIAKRVGAWAERATYERTGAGLRLKVLARSVPGQVLRVAGSGVHFELSGHNGHNAGLADVAALPSDAKLFNVSDDPPTAFDLQFVDQVLVASIVHDLDAGTVTVVAQSSDPTATLTAPALGNVAITSGVPIAALVGFASLEIVSNRGGRGRQQVALMGSSSAMRPVEARAAVDAPHRMTGFAVRLIGSGSPGATAHAWTAVSPAALAALPANANAADTDVLPTMAGTHTYRLTVQGQGGQQSAEVSFDVAAAPTSDAISDVQCEYRTGTRQWRIRGQVDHRPNTIEARLNGHLIAKGTPDIDGAWSLRMTLGAGQQHLEPGVNDSVTVHSMRSSRSSSVRIRN